MELSVEFLVTKHGLADMLKADGEEFSTLHGYFLDRLVPVCAGLLDAADAEGQLRRRIDAYELMRGVGNVCIGSDDSRYEPRHLIELVLEGLGSSRPVLPANAQLLGWNPAIAACGERIA